LYANYSDTVTAGLFVALSQLEPISAFREILQVTNQQRGFLLCFSSSAASGFDDMKMGLSPNVTL